MLTKMTILTVWTRALGVLAILTMLLAACAGGAPAGSAPATGDAPPSAGSAAKLTSRASRKAFSTRTAKTASKGPASLSAAAQTGAASA